MAAIRSWLAAVSLCLMINIVDMRIENCWTNSQCGSCSSTQPNAFGPGTVCCPSCTPGVLQMVEGGTCTCDISVAALPVRVSVIASAITLTLSICLKHLLH
ncbi:uncharacterized protein LOC124124513 [Haliotis rufescens]|uniref:uncharacterized protein LOC124124513 n=1 Tax=Haliotis rufescens TaxID=6454 RepID=UPI00201ECBDC|nr:uncharacterized protein LOC124124513 [Haliotis rufescens]